MVENMSLEVCKKKFESWIASRGFSTQKHKLEILKETTTPPLYIVEYVVRRYRHKPDHILTFLNPTTGIPVIESIILNKVVTAEGKVKTKRKKKGRSK